MPATLTWIDFDAASRERSLRILALFQEKESRDELGLGAIRDSLSDHFFPGTSTIQTRLRYMLFVPWVYQVLEERRVPSRRFGADARWHELHLVRPLLENDDRRGVFGSQAGQDLKRLPSSIYWAGLGAWGIRRIQATQGEYHHAVDRLYQRRDLDRGHADGEDDVEPIAESWHPRLPEPPPEFPEHLDFALRAEESAFLRDCIATYQPDSLLAYLVQHGGESEVDQIWQHPELRRFPSEHQTAIEHARRFAAVMPGAAQLYNLSLADLDGREDIAESRRADLDRWAAALESARLADWDLDAFWALAGSQGYRITRATRGFVMRWIERVLEVGPAAVADDARARQLVQQRERILKGARSRYVNQRAREQWSGRAGLVGLGYRWVVARRYLGELLAGDARS